MLPVTDPHNIFSEMTPGTVSPAVAEDLPRLCITGDESTRYLARDRSRCRDEPTGAVAVTLPDMSRSRRR